MTFLHCKFVLNIGIRDIEFDLDQDKRLCLYGLEPKTEFSPSDVMRVTDIFEDPVFFFNGPSSSDISQGADGDCYFLAALSMGRLLCSYDIFCSPMCFSRHDSRADRENLRGSG
jgi:hypothetical protein